MTVSKEMIKKSYYDSMESTLRAIKYVSEGIENLRNTLSLVGEEDHTKGICYDQEIIKTNNISKPTEVRAFKNMEDREKIEKRLKVEEGHIEHYRRSLRNLEFPMDLIIEHRYFNGDNWDEIEEKVNYSKRQCMRLAEKGIAALTLTHYGFRSLKRKAIESNDIDKKTNQ